MRGARRRPVPRDPHGQASIATDQVETFTEHGIKLESGEELEADIVITATGLNLVAARRASPTASTASRSA